MLLFHPLRFLRRWWRQRSRDCDHVILFPTMRALAHGDDAHFANAVRMHMCIDDAWNVDYEELSQRDKVIHDQVMG